MSDRPTLAELDIIYDEDGNQRPGFLVGKAAALADWQAKKEAKEFARLENSLRVRKWRHELYE